MWKLFSQLRRHQFPLGSEDYAAMQQALLAGFGWESREALQDLCCALWAKSKRDEEVVIALFGQVCHQTNITPWELTLNLALPSGYESIDVVDTPSNTPIKPEQKIDTPIETSANIETFPESSAPKTMSVKGILPPLDIDWREVKNYPETHFIFVSQYPLSYREIAQAFRRLRLPMREGPAIELDLEATLKQRTELGVVGPITLRPRRRNVSRLLLLIDWTGSMTPFHGFIKEICTAIRQSGNLRHVAIYYFHDVPVEGADTTLLTRLPAELFPTLDAIQADIQPLKGGFVYADPEFQQLCSLDEVLYNHATKASVIFISDGGAARGQYDLYRLLDTVAFLKRLRQFTTRYVWLNPLMLEEWAGSTAAQIARYIPMRPLNRLGLEQVVKQLRQ